MPVMTVYQTFRAYDPMLDCEVLRISGFDGRGGEFWRKEPLSPPGRSRRAQIDAALELIEEAIAAGCEPGEVIAA